MQLYYRKCHGNTSMKFPIEANLSINKSKSTIEKNNKEQNKTLRVKSVMKSGNLVLDREYKSYRSSNCGRVMDNSFDGPINCL